jgi:acyl dehydratase
MEPGEVSVKELENFTFDELTVGQTAEYSRTLGEDDIILFAAVSGDVNPVHLDEDFARTTMFRERIAHGMYTGGLISAALAMKLPGPGTIYLGQNLKFERPVKLGDTITVQLKVLEKIAGHDCHQSERQDCGFRYRHRHGAEGKSQNGCPCLACHRHSTLR